MPVGGGWWHVMLAQPLLQWKAGCSLLELLYTSVTGSERDVFRTSTTSNMHFPICTHFLICVIGICLTGICFIE